MNQPVQQFGRVGVLMGGYSSEREISLKSGKAVFEALIGAGCDALALDIRAQEEKRIAELIREAQMDVAFITLHGRLGEDGVIQSILDGLNIPYTGSGPEASRRAINKVTTQDLLRQHGIPVAPSFGVSRKEESSAATILKKIPQFPIVVKPSCEGSSIGVSLVRGPAGLEPALNLAWQYGDEALIEQYLEGRELTVGILDEMPLPVIEICPKENFFDFNAKYQSGTTEYILPAKLEEKVADDIGRTALMTHRLLGCRDLSRVDFILDNQARHYVLEINTIPGFTSMSLLPKAAKLLGINFEQLCLKLVKLAYGKKKESGTFTVGH